MRPNRWNRTEAANGHTAKPYTKPREIYGADDAEDWDVCTGFAKNGKCLREGCRWRHDNAVWWEGGWWRADGKGWDDCPAPSIPRKASPKQGWWRTAPPSDECPVSLTRICDLDSEPFGLTAASPEDATMGKDAHKHYFDATALAMFLVSSGQFMNPINRRPLELSECRALDAHMGKSSLRVADAFVLAGGGTASSGPARELASMAHHLFHYPSIRDRGASNSGASGQKPASIQDATREWRQPVGRREARTVHAEGGLQVVDENESGDEETVAAQDFPDLTADIAPAAKPRRAPRPARPDARDVAPSCGYSETRCNAAPSQKGKPKIAKEEGEQPSSASSAAVWVPPWATVELQRQQIQEVERLLSTDFFTADEHRLQAMRISVNNGVLMTDGDGISCEIRGDGADLVVDVQLPLFYPSMPVVISARSNDPTESADVLSAFERVLREDVLRPVEGEGVLEAVAIWLQDSALDCMERLRRDVRADAIAAPAAVAPVPEPVPQSEHQVRVADKYSPNWDLCTGFVRTGKCKNKNCKWRHEMPAPKEPTKKVETAKPELGKAETKKKKR